MSIPASRRRGPAEHDFEDELRPARAVTEHLSLEDLRDVRLTITADLGDCRLLVREILDLRRGSVLTLNKLAGEMADLYVNGVLFARGEIVVLGDTLHVRIAEVIGVANQEPLLGD